GHGRRRRRRPGPGAVAHAGDGREADVARSRSRQTSGANKPELWRVQLHRRQGSMADSTAIFGFSKADVDRIGDAVDYVEGFPRSSRVPLRRQAPSDGGPSLQWCHVTSMTAASGRYPGVWVVMDDSGASPSFTDQGSIWVVFANGAAP